MWITEIRKQATAETVDLLISDAQLAVTFLDLAEHSPNTDEEREHCFQQAIHAHDIIVRLVPQLTLTEEQNEALMRRLIVLRGRLDRHSTAQAKLRHTSAKQAPLPDAEAREGTVKAGSLCSMK